ncbi:type VI secretion system protein TssA [Lentisphaerota bacterium ZTH]|nr:type VI secretion system protein TssA [Lentisphaerota bacterium]WET05226.1 type VI secretion system protein TssA [Lentisphaerota bacterium ZTH]
MQLNVADLLKPVSEDSPCGSNLEYDPRFLQLDELAEGVPEKQMGDSVIEGRDPDWNELRKNSLELLNETKDLRIALFLTLAELNLDGLPGFDQGLQVLSGLLDNFWDKVYPELDVEDNNDPQERINCVMSLSPEPGAYRDPMMFIQRLRNVPLCKSSNLGKFTLYDVLTSDGSLESENPAELKLVRAAFLDTQPDFIETYRNHALGCIKSVETMKKVFAEQADDHLDFSLLLDSLNAIVKAYDDFAMSKSKSDPEENLNEADSIDESEDAALADEEKKKAKSNSSYKGNGKITNRQQAVALLNKVSAYFESAEPSSPAPYFIKRAIRTAGMNFMDIISDISPAGLDQANTALKPAELITSEIQNTNEPGAPAGAPAKEENKEPEEEKAFNPFA